MGPNGTVPIRPVVIDTREQTPWTFPDKIKTIRRGIHFGDYTLDGLDEIVAIERKSPMDMIGCVGQSRDRFEKHLYGLADRPFAHVIIECSLSVLCSICEQKTSVGVSSLMGSIVSWSEATGVHFWTPDDRRFATALALRILATAERKWDQKLGEVGSGLDTPLHLVGESGSLLSQAVQEYRGGSTLPPR